MIIGKAWLHDYTRRMSLIMTRLHSVKSHNTWENCFSFSPTLPSILFLSSAHSYYSHINAETSQEWKLYWFCETRLSMSCEVHFARKLNPLTVTDRDKLIKMVLSCFIIYCVLIALKALLGAYWSMLSYLASYVYFLLVMWWVLAK
jgi:hypothetical protein